jgi:hypothetical protein
MMVFSNDSAVRVTGQVTENGKVKEILDYADGLSSLEAADKATGLRVIKALERLAKLCKHNTRKEPF